MVPSHRLDSRAVLPNLSKVEEHLTKKLLENPSNLEANFTFSKKYCKILMFNFNNASTLNKLKFEN